MSKKKPSVKDMVTMSIGMNLGGKKPAMLLAASQGKKMRKGNAVPW